jgi:hypothetical protein
MIRSYFKERDARRPILSSPTRNTNFNGRMAPILHLDNPHVHSILVGFCVHSAKLEFYREAESIQS